jgi:DNA-binding MarR family transcriptional regulator
MSAPTPAEREFIERLGLFFEMAGAPRMSGRLFAWLLICDPPHQSITELATALEVSKATISTISRQMQQGQMIERIPAPGSRQHHYQLKSGGWTQIIQSRMAFTGDAREAARAGLSAIGDAPPERRERLEEFLDFYTFLEQEFTDELIRRWEKYRNEKRDERGAGRTGRLPSSARGPARKTGPDPPGPFAG